MVFEYYLHVVWGLVMDMVVDAVGMVVLAVGMVAVVVDMVAVAVGMFVVVVDMVVLDHHVVVVEGMLGSMTQWILCLVIQILAFYDTVLITHCSLCVYLSAGWCRLAATHHSCPSLTHSSF